VARPLIWHDINEPWPKRLLGGTCFVLRFGAGLIGITAAHVIAKFERAHQASSKLTSLLRTARIDLASAIIDRDETLDIATFGVTEDQLTESEAVAIDCRSEWPPPVPDKGREISFGGFPEVLKKAWPQDSGEFRAYVSLSRVEDCTERSIISTYDSQRDSRIRAAPEIPDLGANLSGCSGGPVMIHVVRNGLHIWFPVGLIVEGPRASLDAEPRNYDTFTMRRLHFVNTDGSIRHDSVGWLPDGRSR